ncbi:hypothetical protein V6Z11_A09G128300 [Gossypium hirsutum]
MANFKHCISSSWKWASSYIRFSKAAIFISGLIFSKSFIENAFKAFLISYIIDSLENLSIGGVIAYAAAMDGIQQFLAILIHHLATDRLGDFRVIILTLPCLIFFICWTFASSLSWKQTIMISFIEVAVAYALFICGKRFYLHIPPTRRTAISRLKEARGLVKLIPHWLLFIPYCLVEVAGFSIFILQSDRLDTRINPRISLHSFNKVPVNSLYVFKQFISFLVSMSTKYLIRKFWSSEKAMQRGARYWRMGVGMAIGFGSLLSAWLVEHRRSDLIKKNPNDNKDIPMTILWLAP